MNNPNKYPKIRINEISKSLAWLTEIEEKRIKEIKKNHKKHNQRSKLFFINSASSVV